MTRTPTTRASLLFRLRDPADHQAWVEFVSLYEPLAYRMLRRHGLQDADAREVMQELFLAVSRSIGRFDTDSQHGSFRGWLRRVTRNLLINWLRRRNRRALVTGGSDLHAMLEALPAAGPESIEFEEELRWALIRRAAHQVRSEVQPNTWQAFWQTTVAGVAPAEVAQKLGMQVGAVRMAKCRVLARLQEAIAEWE